MNRGSISLLALGALFCAGPARGWPPRDHRMLVSDAIGCCPAPMAAFLNEHREHVLQGSVDPDTKFMDTLNHTYEVRDGTRNNPDHVAYLSSALIAMIENGAPREKIAYWLGALSHYVADMDQPLHTSDRDRGEAWYHPVFEALNYGFEVDFAVCGLKVRARLGKCLAGHEFRFDGTYDPIDDVRAWQVENARWAHGFYEEIGRIFKGEDEFDPERLGEVYGTCIDEACNDIVDIWVHIFRLTEPIWEAPSTEASVVLIDVDEKGRFRLNGARVVGKELRAELERHAEASRDAAKLLPPAAYAEIDDRCGREAAGRVREICEECGIRYVSTILVRKGSWPGRFVRAARVHIESLVR